MLRLGIWGKWYKLQWMLCTFKVKLVEAAKFCEETRKGNRQVCLLPSSVVLWLLLISQMWPPLCTHQTRRCYFPQKRGWLHSVWWHRLQTDLGCHGEAGGEGSRQIHRPVQLQQSADRWNPVCRQHQTYCPTGTWCLNELHQRVEVRNWQ